jgi:hypothetical protein
LETAVLILNTLSYGRKASGTGESDRQEGIGDRETIGQEMIEKVIQCTGSHQQG